MLLTSRQEHYLISGIHIALRNSKPVAAFVFLVAGMTLYPCKLDFMYRQQFKKTLPQIRI